MSSTSEKPAPSTDSASQSPKVKLSELPETGGLSGNLAGLSLPTQVLVLAIWPFLGQVLNFLVGSVDTALAGRLSVEATNAIGVAAYFGWLFGIVFMSVGNGSTALIARAIGARHKRLANAALGQSMLLATAAGLALGVAVFLLAPWLVTIIQLEGESYDFCVAYLQIIAVASPFAAVLFVGSACLRGAGDTKTPFVVLLLVNVVNIAGSVGLVWAGHGVYGIALGTLVGWVVGCAMTLVVLIKGWGGMRLRIVRLWPHIDTSRRIVRIAWPSFLEGFLGMWLANFLILKMLSWIQNDSAWGAHVVAIRIEGMSYLTAFAVGTAAATLAGQYLGAGNPRLARQAMNLCWWSAAGISFAFGLLFIFLPETLVRLYTDQPELLAESPALLRMCGYVQFFFASAIVLGQGMRGAGDTRTMFWLTAFSTYVVRLPLSYMVGVMMGYGLWGIWVGLCVELAFRGCLFIGRYLQGGWSKVEV